MTLHAGGKKGLKEFSLVRPEDENLKPKEQEEEAFRDYLQFYAPSGFEFQQTPGKPSKA